MTMAKRKAKTKTKATPPPPPKSQLRERGTLKKTLPKPVAIVVIFWLICTGAATYLSHYSSPEGTNDTYRKLFTIAIKAGLGVASSTYSMLYNDPFVHLISYTFDLFLSTLLDKASSFQASDFRPLAPSLIVFTLSRLKSTRPTFQSVCNRMGSQFFVNSFNLTVWSMTPILALIIVGSFILVENERAPSDADETYHLIAPSIFIGMSTLVIFHTYFQRRAHQHGNLTLGQMGPSVVVGMMIETTTLSRASISRASDATFAINMMPFLLGATFAIGAAASFAGVADVWYAVGTGQFQMISLDTAGIMFYFALPLWVLTLRFFDKYGDFVHNQITMVIAEDVVETLDMYPIAIENNIKVADVIGYAYISMVAFLSIVIAIGVPLVKNLCPLNGYVFGRTFIHGEEHSKNIVIAVHFSELFHPSICDRERDSVWKALAAWKKGSKVEGDWGKALPLVSDGLLNIIVTASDLKQSPGVIKKLHGMGHEIVIAMDESGRTESIQTAYTMFQKSLGCSPQWYHTGPSCSGATPTCFSTALNLSMRSAMWSIYMNAPNGLSKDQKRYATAELVTHRGGSILYLGLKSKNGSQVSLRSLNDILALVSSLEEVKLLPTSLSLAIADKNQMDL